jgi:phage baseplate assembly protein W
MAYYTDIDLSFKKHPATGDILKKTDINAVKTALKHVFMYNPLDKPFNPWFGIGLREYLFENLNYVDLVVMEKKIKYTIERYEPRAKIEKIDIQKEPVDGAINIVLTFHVEGYEAIQDLSFVVERTR